MRYPSGEDVGRVGSSSNWLAFGLPSGQGAQPTKVPGGEWHQGLLELQEIKRVCPSELTKGRPRQENLNCPHVDRSPDGLEFTCSIIHT